MNKYTWNPVYNMVMYIKNKYLKEFDGISYNPVSFTDQYGITKEISCLEDWIIELYKMGCIDSTYINLIEPLQINQLGTMLLIRYGKYSDVFSGETEITNDNFWDLHDGFYQECRSVVIDVYTNEIVLSPFKKFRNLNECEENKLENIVTEIAQAKSVEFTNKLDGSMQSARWNEGIAMAGSQSLDKNQSWRLQDGYNMLTSQLNYVKMLRDNPDYTFIFEFISLKDAHVVNYKKEDEGLYLIGMRNVYTGEQLSYRQVKEYATKYNVKMTQIFDKTLDQVLQDTKTYKSNELEGFVLNVDGHMVKIKADDYVQVHRILSKISSINLIIKHIADNTFDDLISKVPECYKWRVMKVANLIFGYLKCTDSLVKNYFVLAPKDNKKDFMLWVESNVPKEFRGYVRSLYLGQKINYIKSGNEQNPSYKKLKDMGITESYSAIFSNEE